MPLQAESLGVLETADLAPAHARAIVRAIEIELYSARRFTSRREPLLWSP
jgi:hypothetical protein